MRLGSLSNLSYHCVATLVNFENVNQQNRLMNSDAPNEKKVYATVDASANEDNVSINLYRSENLRSPRMSNIFGHLFSSPHIVRVSAFYLTWVREYRQVAFCEGRWYIYLFLMRHSWLYKDSYLSYRSMIFEQNFCVSLYGLVVCHGNFH